MQVQNDSEISLPPPLRIGVILDQSIRLFPKLMRNIWFYYLALAVFPAVQQIPIVSYNWVLSLSLSFVFLLASYPLSILVTFISAAVWVNEPLDIKTAWKRVTFNMLFKTVVLSTIIATLSFFGLLLFVIPGIVYYMNRILAINIMVLEGRSVGFSLRKSRHLMTREKWWKSSSPLVRVNGLLLFFLITYTFVSLISGAVSALTMQESFPFSQSVVFLFQYGLGLISMLIPLLNQLCFVGFYFDLRSRYEALDLFSELEKVSSSTKNRSPCQARSALGTILIWLVTASMVIAPSISSAQEMPEEAPVKLSTILQQDNFQPRNTTQINMLSEIFQIILGHIREWMKSLNDSSLFKSSIWKSIAAFFNNLSGLMRWICYFCFGAAFLLLTFKLYKWIRTQLPHFTRRNTLSPGVVVLPSPDIALSSAQLKALIARKEWSSAIIKLHRYLRQIILEKLNLSCSTTDREVLANLSSAHNFNNQVSALFNENALDFEAVAFARASPPDAELHLGRSIEVIPLIESITIRGEHSGDKPKAKWSFKSKR